MPPNSVQPLASLGQRFLSIEIEHARRIPRQVSANVEDPRRRARLPFKTAWRWYSGAVFWVQGLACFLLWIGYGIVQSRRTDRIREKLGGLSRGVRGGLGGLLMVLGAAVLLGGGLLIEQVGGFTKSGM